MAGPFLYRTTHGISGGAVAITISDTTTYDPPLQAITVNASGTVVLTFADATTATVQLTQGMVHQISGITKIGASSTATGIVGWRG